MNNILIRQLPSKVYQQVRREADSENLSLNQFLVRLIAKALAELEEKKEIEARRAQAFKRINEMRQELYLRHGLMEDSTKIIREAREERTKRLDGSR